MARTAYYFSYVFALSHRFCGFCYDSYFRWWAQERLLTASLQLWEATKVQLQIKLKVMLLFLTSKMTRFLYGSHHRFIITHLLYLLESWQFVHRNWPITADSNNVRQQSNAKKRNVTVTKRGKIKRKARKDVTKPSHDWFCSGSWLAKTRLLWLVTLYIKYERQCFIGISKHWEGSWKKNIFDEIRGVWIADETLSRVFDISSQSKQKLKGKRRSKIVKIYAN